jgi:uncharacterized protein (TIGR00369 family)
VYYHPADPSRADIVGTASGSGSEGATDDERSKVSAADPRLAELFDKAPITDFLGHRLVRCDKGTAEVELPHRRDHEQGFGITHGGIVATLADTAGFFAAASLAGPGLATVEFKINLVAPVRQETLRATGTVVHRGHRLILCQIHVVGHVVGGSEAAVAFAQATYTTVAVYASFEK